MTDLDGVMPPPAASYALDPVHTFAEFRVRHLIVGKVCGRFDSIGGDFDITDDPEHLFGDVEVRIAAASIEARDKDLRSARFFDVENFPTITFRVNGGAKAEANVWTVSGDLTIRHITRPILVLESGDAGGPNVEIGVDLEAVLGD